MSSSSDLMIGDTFKDKVYIIETATGNPWAAQAPTCTLIDEAGNRSVNAVVEESNGWYTSTFSPDASGTWSTEWALAGSTIYFAPKIFRVGQTAVHDIDTALAVVDGVADNIALDTRYIADSALPAAPTGASLAAEIGNFIASGDGDFAGGTKLPSNISLYDLIGGANGHSAYPAAAAPANGVNLMAVTHLIADRTEHHLITRTFFSPSQIEVVADTTHTDANLPTVTLPNITGTIVSVYAGFKFRMIENTNAAVNKLSGAQEIQVDGTDAINFVDDQFGLAASTREGGDCVIGTVDLVAVVDVFNHAYTFMWDEPLTDQNALHFNDVQTFLIVSYY
jgi:hypothetical protein